MSTMLAALVGLGLIFGAGRASARSHACLPSLPLVDSHGKAFNPASLKGKSTLVDFVHTSCPGVCTTLTGKFSAVAAKLGPQLGSDVMLLSVSNDPAHDKPGNLLKLAQKRGADMSGWLFVTGKPDDIAKMLETFGLSSGLEPDGEPAHIPQVFLVGPDGCTVRDYNGIIMNPDTFAGDLKQSASGGEAKAHSKVYQHL